MDHTLSSGTNKSVDHKPRHVSSFVRYRVKGRKSNGDIEILKKVIVFRCVRENKTDV